MFIARYDRWKAEIAHLESIEALKRATEYKKKALAVAEKARERANELARQMEICVRVCDEVLRRLVDMVTLRSIHTKSAIKQRLVFFEAIWAEMDRERRLIPKILCGWNVLLRTGLKVGVLSS